MCMYFYFVLTRKTRDVGCNTCTASGYQYVYFRGLQANKAFLHFLLSLSQPNPYSH